MRHARTTDRQRERGTVMVIAALALTALLLFAALAIDVGALWSSRAQSQSVSDVAALAAASKMIEQSGSSKPVVRTDLAETEGNNYAAKNYMMANPSAQVDQSSDSAQPNVDGDFKFGEWNFDTRTLDTSVPLTDPNRVTAVQVNVRMDDSANKRSPSFLSRLIGRDGFDVKTSSVAYLGFVGSFPPGGFDLPVGIDSCKISTGGSTDRCGSDFCATVSSPPHPCGLEWHQGAEPVTCLEFASTPEQNACWTVFRNDTPSVNNPLLQGILDNGNPGTVEAGDKAYFDNGSKDETLKDIRNMFYGCSNQGDNCCIDVDETTGTCTARTGSSEHEGSQPKGRDLYGPNPASEPGNYAPTIDSWVVLLPVFECDPGGNCAGGGPIKIMGGVCFEIREVLAPSGDYGRSSQRIKGRFLCPTSDDEGERELFDKYCRDDSEPQDTGGCNFGLFATRPVLVQ